MLVAFVLFLPRLSYGEVIKIQGHWSVKSSDLNILVTNQMFEAYLEGSNYYFIVASTVPRHDGFVHVTFDGADTFSIRYPIGWYVPGDLLPTVTTNDSAAIGEIHPGSFPTNQIAPIQLLWLAFEAHFQSNRQSNCQWPLWCLLDYDQDSYKSFTSIADRDNDLITSIKFIAPPNGTNKEGVKYAYAAPYDKGLLYAAYHVAATKSLKNLTLPSEWSFDAYAAKTNAQFAQDVEVFSEWSFLLDSVELVDRFPSDLPVIAPKAKILVNDYRIRTEDDETYGFQIGVQNETMLHRSSSQFSRISGSIEDAVKLRQPAQKLFLPLFFLISVPVAALIIWRAKRTRQ